MKKLLFFVCIIMLISSHLWAQESKSGQPKKVIYETDMCLDVDDVGAIASLHAMADAGEVELLAICFNEVHPSGVAAIDAINTWYGRGDIPIGTYKEKLADPDTSSYLDYVAQFPHDITKATAPSALEIYLNVLRKQPDKSVTIISVGFLNNLYDLLKADPDLVKRKVVELVVMGGLVNDGFNLSRHDLVDQTQYILENWPTPVLISQRGGSIHTGEKLSEAPDENPVREAYYRYWGEEYKGRSSWDQVAVLYGVRGLQNYFEKVTTGNGELRNGFKWDLKPGFRIFLKAKLSDDEFAEIIEALMIQLPRSMQPKKVIYETDMCLDVDDVGAIASLHAMADGGEVDILAVCFNEVHPSGAAAIDAINTWYGRGDIPIGIYKGVLKDPDESPYLDYVAEFPHDLTSENAPSALDVYLKVLGEQPDKSVTIISVGFTNNLYDLLKTNPELIEKKVVELVVMAGIFHDGFNLVRHDIQGQTAYVLSNWPTPLVISQRGGSIHTGEKLSKAPAENPVREGYYRYWGEEYKGRSSWDQVAVLYGVRGLENYFNEISSGVGRLPNGYEWELKPGCRLYLEGRLTDDEFAEIIEAMMIKPPANK